jgi:hypothetical protein
LRPSAEIALEKRTRLLNQNIADDWPVQTVVVDSVLKRAELDRSVILFDHVNHQQACGGILCYRESYGIRGAAARKAIAAAARVAEVATFLLMVIVTTFGEIRRGCMAGSAKQIA